MKIYDNLLINHNIKNDGIISIGYFDSVHLGHQKILRKLVEISTKNNLTNCVLTFTNLPKKDINNRTILELEKRIEIIKSLGVKNLILCKYNEEFASMTPEFFIKTIKNNFNITNFVVGKDFGFGKQKSGDIKTLTDNGFKVEIVDPYCIDGKKVSTSIIKSAILKGNIPLANNLTGRNYFIEGIVSKGKQLGRTIGFPTMNINNQNIIFPQSGIYVTKTLIKNLEYYSMTYVTENIIETNLIGFSDFRYNFKIKIDFFKKIRDTKVFQNFDKLKEQLLNDLEVTKNFFGIKNTI